MPGPGGGTALTVAIIVNVLFETRIRERLEAPPRDIVPRHVVTTFFNSNSTFPLSTQLLRILTDPLLLLLFHTFLLLVTNQPPMTGRLLPTSSAQFKIELDFPLRANSQLNEDCFSSDSSVCQS